MTERRTRILFVTQALKTGGTERHLALLLPEMKARGWEVAVFCLEREGRHLETMRAHGVPVFGPDARSGGGPFASAFGLPERFARLAWTMTAGWRPDIVHYFLPRAYLYGAPVGILTRVPVRIMSRRSLNHYQRKSPAVRTIERVLHRYMDAILANSRSVADQLTGEEGCDPGRVHTIYNGIPVPAHTGAVLRGTLRSRLGLPADALVMTIVANLIAYKGHRDLIEALLLAAARLPREWTLLCLGRDDGEGAGLRAAIRQAGLEDHVVLMGERDDACDVLAASDVGILASHEEGFSNAILESMAAGLPVIVTDVGGNAEAVLDGQTGLVVPPRDPQALCEAIVRLAGDPARARSMGVAGRARLMDLFALETCVAGYDALYRRLCPRPGRRSR